MTNYSKRYENIGVSKVYPKYVAFLLGELMKKIKNNDILSKTNRATYSVSFKTNNPDFKYCWEGICLVNKTLNKMGLTVFQNGYKNHFLADGNKKEIIYTFNIMFCDYCIRHCIFIKRYCKRTY